MNLCRIEIIWDWSTSKIFCEVQVFLDFANFYRHFIKHYSCIAESLTGLIKSSKNDKKFKPFSFLTDVQKMFILLCKVFINVSILVHFDSVLKIKIETDASNFALTDIISQLLMNEEWHSVAFWSRKMISSENRYKMHNQKLLVIVIIFKHWCHYLKDSYQIIEILTDHNNLQEFMKVKELNERQVWWVMRLTAFDFVISYRSGKTNSADVLLKHSDYKSVEKVSETMRKLLLTLQRKLVILAAVFSSEFFSMMGRILAEVKKTVRIRDSELETESLRSNSKMYAQHKCNIAELQLNSVAETVDCKQLISHVMMRELFIHETAEENSSQSLQKLIQTLQDCNIFVAERCKALEVTASKMKCRVSTRKSILWRVNFKDLLFHEEQLYVLKEESLRAELLKHHYDDVLAEHFKVERTLELIDHKYYWSDMSKNVKNYVFSYNICQRVKVSRHCLYSEMQVLLHSEESWQKVTMNFITDLSLSKHRDCIYNAILVIVDCYTKIAQYISTVKTVTAVQLTDLFYEKIVCCFKTLREVMSDWDSVFTSVFWSDLCYHMKMKCRLSTVFHSQTDEQTECQNQTLKHYIRCYCSDEQDNWTNLLSLTEFAYQNRMQALIECSLFYAMHSYHSTIHYIEDDSRKEKMPAVKKQIKQIHEIREVLMQW